MKKFERNLSSHLEEKVEMLNAKLKRVQNLLRVAEEEARKEEKRLPLNEKDLSEKEKVRKRLEEVSEKLTKSVKLEFQKEPWFILSHCWFSTSSDCQSRTTQKKRRVIEDIGTRETQKPCIRR